MRWAAPRHSDRSRRERLRPGLTSLVDVVFLLLVFFLLAGSLRAAAPFDVVPPEGTIGASLVEERASVWLASDGRVALGEETLALPILIEHLSAAAPAATDIRLHADANARASQLLPLLEALREAGVGEIELIVRDPS